MDEMKIQSKLMRGILSRIITKELKKKLGCDVNIRIRSLSAATIDNTTRIHVDVDGEINTEDLDTLISQVI